MKKILLVGRWQPLHNGHRALIQYVLDKGHKPIVAIRETEKDDNNPYSVSQRIAMIKEAFGNDVEINVISDIDEIWHGRDVGYKVVKLDDHIENISATKIREMLRKMGIL